MTTHKLLCLLGMCLASICVAHATEPKSVLPPHAEYLPLCVADPPPNAYITQHPQINIAVCQCYYEVLVAYPPTVSPSEHIKQAVACYHEMEDDPGAFTQKYVQRSELHPDLSVQPSPTK